MYKRQEQNYEAFADDAPPLDNEHIYSGIMECIGAKREQRAADWLSTNIPSNQDIKSSDAPTVNMYRTQLLDMPPYLSCLLYTSSICQPHGTQSPLLRNLRVDKRPYVICIGPLLDYPGLHLTIYGYEVLPLSNRKYTFNIRLVPKANIKQESLIVEVRQCYLVLPWEEGFHEVKYIGGIWYSIRIKHWCFFPNDRCSIDC